MPKEQRSEERLPVRFGVKLSVGFEERDGMLVDISRGGAQVAAQDARLRPETEVRLIIQRRAGQAIGIQGRVRWSNAERFAVVFGQLDAAAQKWLDSLLEEEGTLAR
jgi:hypothetical protein